jgi:hypothetical protein
MVPPPRSVVGTGVLAIGGSMLRYPRSARRGEAPSSKVEKTAAMQKAGFLFSFPNNESQTESEA